MRVYNFKDGNIPSDAVRVDRKTKWGNPFVIGKDGQREEVIQKFQAWLLSQPELLASLSELRGKSLVCHCAPQACHADVLMRLANPPQENNQQGGMKVKPVTITKFISTQGAKVELKKSSDTYQKEAGREFYAIIDGKIQYPSKSSGVVDEATAIKWLEKMGYKPIEMIEPTNKEETMSVPINEVIQKMTVKEKEVPNLKSRTEGYGFNEQQQAAFDAIVNGQSNILLTGNAGTGKSYVLKNAVEELRRNGKSVIVCASTALAANAIGGVTMHSAFRIFPKYNTSRKTYTMQSLLEETKSDMIVSKIGQMLAKKINRLDVVVIDEISMLHRIDLERLEYQLRSYGPDADKPYGGIKMVFVGDFLQLEPVSNENSPIQLPKDTSAFGFEARKVWLDAGVKTYLLTEIIRQKEEYFAKFLNNIRIGVWEPWMQEVVDSCIGRSKPDHDIPSFVSTNAEADRINSEKMNALPGEIVKIKSIDRNPNKYDPKTKSWVEDVNYWDTRCLALKSLELKVGALVICLMNNPPVYSVYSDGSIGQKAERASFGERHLINGDSGVVVDFVENVIGVLVPIVHWFRMDCKFGMGVDKFSMGEDEVYREQIPIKPSWAMTVHKAQGMTLDFAEIDVSKAFAAGQVYVAMSRVRTLEGLYIRGFDPNKIKAHPRAIKFYQQTTGMDPVVQTKHEEEVVMEEEFNMEEEFDFDQMIRMEAEFEKAQQMDENEEEIIIDDEQSEDPKEEIIEQKEKQKEKEKEVDDPFMEKNRYVIAGTGTRQLVHDTEKMAKIIDFLVSLLEMAKVTHKDEDVVVMSGMAEGFDEALAKAAIKAQVPLIAAIPSRDYGVYYYKKNSQTKTDRYAEFYEIAQYAMKTGGVVFTCGCTTKSTGNDCARAGHLKKGGVQNFERNQYMVDNCNVLMVYNSNYSNGELMEVTGGTKDCLTRARKANKPYIYVTIPDDGEPKWLKGIDVKPSGGSSGEVAIPEGRKSKCGACGQMQTIDEIKACYKKKNGEKAEVSEPVEEPAKEVDNNMKKYKCGACGERQTLDEVKACYKKKNAEKLIKEEEPVKEIPKVDDNLIIEEEDDEMIENTEISVKKRTVDEMINDLTARGVANNGEEKEVKEMKGRFHGIVDGYGYGGLDAAIHNDNTGEGELTKGGVFRLVTTKIEDYIKDDHQIVESFSPGAYSFAFLDHFFGATGYHLEVMALKDQNANRLHVPADDHYSTIISSTADFQYRLILTGVNEGWLKALFDIGMIIDNSKKMSKRNLELFRQTAAYGYFDKTNDVKIKIDDPKIMGIDEKLVDGISAISQSFAVKLYLNNKTASQEWIDQKIEDIFNGKIAIVSFRMMSEHGLIKSNAIVLPDKMMNGNDVWTFTPNIKKEHRTIGWKWATIEPSYGKLPLRTDDLTMAIYNNIAGIFDHEELLHTMKMAATAAVQKIKKDVGDFDITMDTLDSLSDVDGFNLNYRSTIRSIYDMERLLKDNGLSITVSQSLMFLRANSFGMMFGTVSPDMKVIEQRLGYQHSQGKWFPVPYAYRAHIMTREVLEIFGFKFKQDKNVGFYDHRSHCFVVPGWFFIQNYANHGGYDLDDTINVMVRNVKLINGETKLMAFLLRNPNDFGEWSMIEVTEKELKHCYHIYTDEIPTIDEMELRTRVPQLTDMLDNDMITYQYAELPGGSKLKIKDVFNLEDEQRIRSSAEFLPGGTGQTVLPKILHYALIGEYISKQAVSNEQIIDAVQQGVGTREDYKMIAEFAESIYALTVHKLKEQNKKVDAYWYKTRMARNTKAYERLGFFGKTKGGGTFSLIETADNSPIMQMMYKREKIVMDCYLELVEWANTESKAPEFIKEAFTHAEVIAERNSWLKALNGRIGNGDDAIEAKKAWPSKFVKNLLGADAANGNDATNIKLLKMFLYNFVMKERYPTRVHDQWLFSIDTKLDIQPVHFFVRAVNALRSKKVIE